MQLIEIKDLFKGSLAQQYNDGEIRELFRIFSKKIVEPDKISAYKGDYIDLSISEEKRFYTIISQLQSGKPYQQIIGETEFYGLKFFIDENVLIPRPETEELLEFAINKIRDTKNNSSHFKILEIGTGSGIIPIILKKNFPAAEITAIDSSEKALQIAKRNSEFHEADIVFLHQDYLAESLTEIYDVIISNPPYIAQAEEPEIARSVKDFEPKMALFSPVGDPLVFYRKIAVDCETNLSSEGLIFLEINQKYGAETVGLFRNFNKKQLLKDISGNDRIIFVQK